MADFGIRQHDDSFGQSSDVWEGCPYISESDLFGCLDKSMSVSGYFCTRLPNKIVRGPPGGKGTQKNMKNKSMLASEVDVGIFLRLHQSIHLKMQENQHGTATVSHSTTTESFFSFD